MTAGPIRIFVGTDQRQAPAERALERSIRAHTSAEVEITWMRAGDEGWGDEWNRGAPSLAEYKPKSGYGWGTAFSLHRFAVPDLCNYEGRGIYFDSDMIVLGDVAELWEIEIPEGRGIVASSHRLLDVCVFDCAWFQRHDWFRIGELKACGKALGWVRQRLVKLNAISPTLPPLWDCRDTVPSGCKLLHFTTMPTQPWTPYPEAMQYRGHPSQEALKLWRTWSAPESSAPTT